MTVNDPDDSAEPPGVITEILPPTAPVGTVMMIWLAEITWNEASTIPTRADVAAPMLLPVTVTSVPTPPLIGVNLWILGREALLETLKLEALVAVPPAVVTPILPLFATVGTPKTMLVGDTTVKGADAPLRVSSVAFAKFEPVTVTAVPAPPEVGLNPEMVGAAVATVTVYDVAEVAVPPGAVTLIGPLTAPAGTVTVSSVAESIV